MATFNIRDSTVGQINESGTNVQVGGADGAKAPARLNNALRPADSNPGVGERPRIHDPSRENTLSKRVFIVHGHDGLLKTEVARFVEKLGYEALILHEQPSKGMTIIEKIASNIANGVGFAIILYTPDDVGANSADAKSGKYSARARQNVVFEHGCLTGSLGKERVVVVVSDATIEFPSDIGGLVYVSTKSWQMDIAKEMRSAGYPVDFNRLI